MLAFVSHFSREYVEYDSFTALRNANCVYYRPVSSYQNLFILSLVSRLYCMLLLSNVICNLFKH